MVVDDDREIRRMMSQILLLDGFTVVEARNGAEAVARLSAGARPTLILLDLVMPQMDGRAFLKWRAQDPVQRQIPVLLLSGHSIDEDEQRELGLCGAISKMLDAEDLLEEVRRHADGAGAAERRGAPVRTPPEPGGG